MKTWALFVLALLALPASALNLRVGAVLLTNTNPFYKELADEMALRGQEAGIQFEFEYSEFDSERQAAQIDALIARKPDAVVLTPTDSMLVGASVEKLNNAGIPVFTVDIANLSNRGKVVSHIASDNRAGGRAAADLMAAALKGKGKVVILNHPKVAAVIDRVLGFREELAKWPDIDIVADIPSWGQRTRATSIMEEFLLMMPGINGVFAINDDSALGALRAIGGAGRSDVVIVGYDGLVEARAEIDKKHIYADVVQYPRELARELVSTIVEYANGQKVPPVSLVKTGLYGPAPAKGAR